jgi:transcriptional regulator with GAF, ATPase, and Fis domain
VSVLVLGETGVGKGALAREIHDRSRRASKPFVVINCASSTELLLERIVFGYEPHALPGAAGAQLGAIESAHGGTLVLDEVAELPLALQGKLLDVLDRYELTRIGAARATRVDTRFIATTNRDLARDVAEGRFRQDLYFRLKGIAYRVPPLRDRVDDIARLAHAFVDEAARRLGVATPALSAGALTALRAYAWPGNVRELAHVIERAVLACDTSDAHANGTIEAKHLALEGSLHASLRARERSADAREASGDAERRRVLDAIAKSGGNQREAARILGISRGTLAKRLTAFGIARPRKRAPDS